MIKTFNKMHGLGNDFIVLNALEQPFDWSAEKIRQLADRFTGIGFDQLLMIENPPDAKHDFSYRIFNADGGEVEHCGNGARCFGKYLHDAGLHDFKTPVRVAVKRGTIEIGYCGKNAQGEALYRVDMGEPDFSFFTSQQKDDLYQPVTVGERSISMGIVSMGNPHAVCQVDKVETAPVSKIGHALQHHPLFPARVNVGFMEILTPERIKLRVFERGVGETQACGTGACAAVAVGIRQGLLSPSVTVELPRGELIIDWQGTGHALFLTGAAVTVFTGEICD